MNKKTLYKVGFLAAIVLFGFAGSASAALVVSCSASPNPADVNQLATFSSNVSGGTGIYSYIWVFACTGNASTCQETFSSAGSYTAYLNVVSGNESETASCSLVVNQNCVTHDHKVCYGNSVYWYNSCGNKEDQFQACGSSQICQTNACVDVACTTNAQCGTNGFTGNQTCSGNAIYQNYRTYICNNPGTVNASCTHSDTAQLKDSCASGQTCSNGQCQNLNITCSTNSQCGTNGFVGSAFCQSGDVYRSYRTYVCHNAGFVSSYCSNSSADQLITNCTTNQTCSSGQCQDLNITCSTNSACGTNGFIGSPFCQNGDVYKAYRTYICNNPGTANSSCSNSSADQLFVDCTVNQTCSSGQCSSVNIVCSSNFACGTNGYVGSAFCQSGNVYQNYRTYTCNNPGTANSSCSNSDSAQLKTTCSSSQTCSNGSCSNQDNLSVQTNSATNIYNNQATLNGYVSGATSTNTYVWFQWGTSTSYGNETTHQQQNSNNSFSQVINLYSENYYHYRAVAQNNSGIIYGQDMTFNSSNTNQNFLTITKTVRNMTTGNYGWSNSVYASPSDVLMFMITLQATGNQSAQNVFVRDYLPSNLIYRNQLVISGSNNYYNNYSGDITSGINFGTITAGQIITITYQAQVGPAQNFSYGTTTLNNNVSVTSSNSGYNPTGNATIFVNRVGVLGASSISTGLTNNFWLDSFFLPLLIALAGVWIFKSGILRISERLDYFKSRDKDYKANKQLQNRISKIQKTEVKL